MSRIVIILTGFVLSLGLAACSGGGGGAPAATPPTITSFELLDPTPGAGDTFGTHTLLLPNGNIVVSDPQDSSVVANGGAVHLYDPLTKTLIASIYGDVAGDQLGLTSVTALANNNLVVASQFDDEGGIVDAGSVRLVNGATGVQIGATLAGDVLGDELGRSSVTALANNNFVVASERDDEGGIADVGSVRLVNGTTGVEIGAPFVGSFDDDLVSMSVTGSVNGDYYLISLPDADNGGLLDSGLVRLIKP